MKEKANNTAAVILAILLGISLFYNGWMAHEFKVTIKQSAPKNCDVDCEWWQWIFDPLTCSVCG